MTAKKIESHSAALNNQRIQFLLIQIDQLALSASNSLGFKTINSYYNSVEQLYINIKDVFQDNSQVKKHIEDVRKQYHESYDLIVSNPSAQTMKGLNHLMRLTRKYNSNLITALQSELEYFYRTGIRETKGLLNIPFYELTKENEEDEM